MTFSKILVARYSPQNKCFAPNGTVLTVKPLANVPIEDHVAHFFISTDDQKTKSKYGFVKEVAPFSIDDFVTKYMTNRCLTEDEREHLKTMLVSIAKLTPDTPVAATYSRRGIEKKRMEFTVHRVLFYKASSQDEA